MTGRNVAASVRGRLLTRARETRQDFSLVLTRYAIERLLYRIGVSRYADHFLLKGALLFDLWFDVPHRPTRDIDLLGFGSAELLLMESTFKEISAIAEDDGVTFDPDTVRATEIRKDANYAGVRVGLLGSIDGARCQIQVDIGFGDAVTPDPDDVEYPVMLPEFAAPKLRAYPHYTVVAEKLEALTSLGMANSRMKDYFDLWVLARYADFDADILRRAVRATFDRRATSLTGSAPLGLTDTFAQDVQKDAQWRAFLKRNRLEGLALNDVIAALRRFLLPVAEAAASHSPLRGRWTAGGPWSREESV